MGTKANPPGLCCRSIGCELAARSALAFGHEAGGKGLAAVAAWRSSKIRLVRPATPANYVQSRARNDVSLRHLGLKL
jgi:hypothetical protein